jgi:hypothetical protein
MTNNSGDVGKFKRALDKQNEAERGRSSPEKHQRDRAEGEAAHHGLRALGKDSKGRPQQDGTKQDATTKKSPQSTRNQSR